MWKFGAGYGIKDNCTATVRHEVVLESGRKIDLGWRAAILGNVIGYYRTRREAVAAIESKKAAA